MAPSATTAPGPAPGPVTAAGGATATGTGAGTEGGTARTAGGLAVLLGTAGALHLARPGVFAAAVPAVLGAPRPWVLASGVVEIACAAALAAPRTRRVGGAATALLMLAVWPGNVSMALRARRSGSTARRVVTAVRLPLQVPLVLAGARVARGAGA